MSAPASASSRTGCSSARAKCSTVAITCVRYARRSKSTVPCAMCCSITGITPRSGASQHTRSTASERPTRSRQFRPLVRRLAHRHRPSEPYRHPRSRPRPNLATANRLAPSRSHPPRRQPLANPVLQPNARCSYANAEVPSPDRIRSPLLVFLILIVEKVQVRRDAIHQRIAHTARATHRVAPEPFCQ